MKQFVKVRRHECVFCAGRNHLFGVQDMNNGSTMHRPVVIPCFAYLFIYVVFCKAKQQPRFSSSRVEAASAALQSPSLVVRLILVLDPR